VSRQINLYSAVFRPKPKRFSAVWVVAAAVLVALASIPYYAWEAQRLKQVQATQAAGETQLKQLRAQLAALGQQPQKDKSKALEEQVARAEAQLGSGQEVFNWLQSGQAGNREGYAKPLGALARQHLDGVWLTGIDISGASNEFIIKGRALRADLIPGYIKMLRNEEAFRGKSISTLALHEVEIDAKGEQTPADGMSVAAQTQAVRGAQRPALRVVEFSIGTEGALPSKEPAR
jgi:hypothetical protein